MFMAMTMTKTKTIAQERERAAQGRADEAARMILSSDARRWPAGRRRVAHGPPAGRMHASSRIGMPACSMYICRDDMRCSSGLEKRGGGVGERERREGWKLPRGSCLEAKVVYTIVEQTTYLSLARPDATIWL